jgi:hypothetical protein
MKTLAACLFVSSITAVWAAAAPLRCWLFTLTDGSQIKAEPQFESLQLVSKPLGRTLAIPVSAVGGLKTVDENDVLLTMVNGDQLTGRLDASSFKVRASFGDVEIPPKLIKGIVSVEAPAVANAADSHGEFQIDYAGLRWDLWRTGWHVENGKFASQRHIRPGFNYGHWGNGRGGMVITGNGDKSWKDYEVAFDYKMLAANREFFHAHIPGESRGMAVRFRAAAISESWNEPDTGYLLSINPNGSWGLSARNGWCMPGKGWNGSKTVGKNGHLITGKAGKCEDASEARLRLRVVGQTMSAWLDDEMLFEFTHDGGEFEPITYGGFGIEWRWESMGEISNLSVKRF